MEEKMYKYIYIFIAILIVVGIIIMVDFPGEKIKDNGSNKNLSGSYAEMGLLEGNLVKIGENYLVVDLDLDKTFPDSEKENLKQKFLFNDATTFEKVKFQIKNNTISGKEGPFDADLEDFELGLTVLLQIEESVEKVFEKEELLVRKATVFLE